MNKETNKPKFQNAFIYIFDTSNLFLWVAFFKSGVHSVDRKKEKLSLNNFVCWSNQNSKRGHENAP